VRAVVLAPASVQCGDLGGDLRPGSLGSLRRVKSDVRDLRISGVADNLGENDEREKNQKNGMGE
jgi:hypothetical protein